MDLYLYSLTCFHIVDDNKLCFNVPTMFTLKDEVFALLPQMDVLLRIVINVDEHTKPLFGLLDD